MIDDIEKEVIKLLEKDNSGHGPDHIKRVLKLSLKFALIALLHDVDDYKLFGMENAEKLVNARRIMDDCNVEKNIQEQVCNALNNIGYSIKKFFRLYINF